jgi:hypothetical protein
VVEHQDLEAPLPCHACAKQAGGTCANHNDIKTLHGAQCRVGGSPCPTFIAGIHVDADVVVEGLQRKLDAARKRKSVTQQ